MNKASLATILGVAGLSLLKKVSGSKNHEKPFTFTMTFYLEGEEEGVLNEGQYNRTILSRAWLESVRGFIKGTNDFLRYGDEDTPAQMLLEYRQFLQESIPTYIGEFIDQWLTGYIYEQGQWEEYANTIEDVAIQWILPDSFRVLKNSGPDGQDQVMFTYYLSLDEIIHLMKKVSKYRSARTLLEDLQHTFVIKIEDWINVIGYYWINDIREVELFVTDKKLEVDLSLIEPSQRILVEALMKNQARSQLRKF